MKIRFADSRPTGDFALVLPAAGKNRIALDSLGGDRGAVDAALKRQRFEGESGSTAELFIPAESGVRRLIVVGFVWIALGWFAMGGATTLPLVSLALVLRAMGGSANWTYSSVIIQKNVADQYLGRMFSLDMAGFQLASALSILVTGQLVDLVGAENVRQVVGLMGLVSLVPLVLWTVAIPRLEKADARAEVAPAVAGD